MKKPEISFRYFDGSGPLSIYWHPGPYGIAVEAIKGSGVGWFSHPGDILGVEFDDVTFKADNQTIEFKNGFCISIKVKQGKTTVNLHRSKRRKAA